MSFPPRTVTVGPESGPANVTRSLYSSTGPECKVIRANYGPRLGQGRVPFRWTQFAKTDSLRKMQDLLEIDGVQLPLETPQNAEELAHRVARCSTDGTAIYPVGGRLGLDYGTLPSRPGIALSLAKLNRVI